MSTAYDKLKSLADAIRNKSGVSGKLTLDGMKEAVDSIDTTGSGQSSIQFFEYAGQVSSSASGGNSLHVLSIEGLSNVNANGCYHDLLDNTYGCVEYNYMPAQDDDITAYLTFSDGVYTITDKESNSIIAISGDGYTGENIPIEVCLVDDWSVTGGGYPVVTRYVKRDYKTILGYFFTYNDNAKAYVRSDTVEEFLTDINIRPLEVGKIYSKDTLIEVNRLYPYESVNSGSGNSAVRFGYWTSDGKFQEIDLSGDAPINSGNAQDMYDLIMFRTGHGEPDYPAGGGGSVDSAIKFYECAVSPTTFINESPVNPTQNQTTEYVITTSSEYDSNYSGYNAFSDTADQDKGWFCATGDDAPWVAIEFNEGFILESYSFALSWDNRGQTLSKWKLEGSLDGTSWNTIDERETETLTSASPTFHADIVNYSMYTHYRLSLENEYGHIGVQGWKLFSAEKTAGGTWSGYEMIQDADGGWLKSENLTKGLLVKGYNPMVGYIYNEDTTISVTSMYVASQEGVTQ